MDYYSTESIKLMIDHSKQSLKLSRSTYLANEIVIIDGLPGCGKTMLSPILSSFDRVELISYAFEVEWTCRLNYLRKIDKDAANFMVHNLIDHKIYQTMMVPAKATIYYKKAVKALGSFPVQIIWVLLAH